MFPYQIFEHESIYELIYTHAGIRHCIIKAYDKTLFKSHVNSMTSLHIVMSHTDYFASCTSGGLTGILFSLLSSETSVIIVIINRTLTMICIIIYISHTAILSI